MDCLITLSNQYLLCGKCDSLWVNYQKQHDFNPLHNHRGNLSFVSYLNVPEELKTEKERYNMIGNGPIPGSIMFSSW